MEQLKVDIQEATAMAERRQHENSEIGDGLRATEASLRQELSAAKEKQGLLELEHGREKGEWKAAAASEMTQLRQRQQQQQLQEQRRQQQQRVQVHGVW